MDNVTLELYKEEVEKNPDDVFMLASYAFYLHADQQSEEALKILDRVLELDPSYEKASYLKGVIYLSMGDYEKGWEYFVTQASWNGEKTDQLVSLYQDQGFGDFFQFARYIPYVHERCPNLQIACWPELVDLLKDSFPEIEITTLLNNPLSCPITNLGAVFKMIPNKVPYLKTNLVSDVKAKIGVLWTSDNTHTENFLTNCIHDYNIVRPLLERPDVTSLRRRDLNNAQFNEIASIVNKLDLIITTDTALPHLAGALGRPTWILLSYDADGRWAGRQKLESCWYPTMRIFRQKEAGNWKDVIDEVIIELEKKRG